MLSSLHVLWSVPFFVIACRALWPSLQMLCRRMQECEAAPPQTNAISGAHPLDILEHVREPCPVRVEYWAAAPYRIAVAVYQGEIDIGGRRSNPFLQNASGLVDNRGPGARLDFFRWHRAGRHSLPRALFREHVRNERIWKPLGALVLVPAGARFAPKPS